MNKTAIGIDVGGTKVSVSLGTIAGKILARREFPTPLREKSKEALARLDEIITDFLTIARLRKLRVAGIGVGLPGAVNTKLGIIPSSPNLQGWENLPLKKKLETRFRLPVFFGNDANAAACAEKTFGTARSSESREKI